MAQDLDRDGYTFKILGGAVYQEADQPPVWHNATRLQCVGYSPCNAPAMEHLPLDAFPLIDDFEVALEDMLDAGGRSVFGCQVHFFSAARGYLAGFPWWDHAEQDLARHGLDVIPVGDFDEPYTDCDPSWEIVIAEHDDFVYVLEGTFDEDMAEGYPLWFKAAKDRYLEQWQLAIAASRELARSQ